MSVADGLRQAKAVLERAAGDGVQAGVVLATSFGCPLSGEVGLRSAIDAAAQLVEAGAREVVFADTIGVAVPRQVRELFAATSGLDARLGIHTHNTRNMGYACTATAIEHGAVVVDAAVGGLGGCPFAPGASGNIATEDLLYILERDGISSGVNVGALLALGRWLRELGLTLDSAQHRLADVAPNQGCQVLDKVGFAA